MQLAALMAAEWQHDTTTWQKGPHGWVRGTTERGGWQGSRAMQVMFVLGMEAQMRKAEEDLGPDVHRIGLQDDTTLVGSASAIQRGLPALRGHLAYGGHELVPHKCSEADWVHGAVYVDTPPPSTFC